jgi:PHP family Zn ribbon phosphoesterase
MNCREFVESMFEFCRRELGPNEMALHQAHLASCSRCRQEMTETEACFSMMKACCGTEKMPEGLAQKLHELMAGWCGPRK